MDIRPCGEGFAYAAADPAFGLASAGGMVKSASRSAHRRHAQQVWQGAGDFRRWRDRALWFGQWRRQAGAVRRRGGLARELAHRARQPRARARRRPAGHRLEKRLRAEVQGHQDRPRQPRNGSLARGSARRVRFRFGGRLACPRVRRGGQVDLETAGSGRSLGRRLQRGRPGPRRRLWRRHDPLAAGVGRRGAARAVRRRSDPPLGRLDADRLLHGVARRRGFDRLAPQPRLDTRGRFLPRFALLRALQPARHRATRPEDA